MMTMTKEWFSARELAELKLPGLGHTIRAMHLRAAREGWRHTHLCRSHAGRGGGFEYHYSVLPDKAVKALVFYFVDTPADDVPGLRIAAVVMVDALTRARMKVSDAVTAVAAKLETSESTIYEWRKRVKGLDPADWREAMASHHRGSISRAYCDPAAWLFLTQLLSIPRMGFSAAFRQLVEVAEQQGWTIPSERTLRRRWDALE